MLYQNNNQIHWEITCFKHQTTWWEHGLLMLKIQAHMLLLVLV